MSRNLYVVDPSVRRIELVSVARGYQHNILSYTYTPTDIALDPMRG